MKLSLIAPTYLPARRANTIQVMKMAQAMTVLGHQVKVLVPGETIRSGVSWEQVAHHYGLQQRFEIQWLAVHPRLRSYDFGWESIRHARNWGADLIYTRLPQAAAVASSLGVPTIYEIHDLPQGTLGPWLLNRFLKGRGARALVMITAALRKALALKSLVHKNLPLIVAPDGVDLIRYKNFPSPDEARISLNTAFHLPSSAFVAGYTGHLYPGRGTSLILEIATQLPDVDFLLVGGEPLDVERLRVEIHTRSLENITLAGFVPNADLPRYQAACDILLMPYQRKVSASSGGDIAKFLSPMKLFEYLACGRVILSSDLPVLKEILNSQNAVLLPPDEVNTWVTAIQDLRANPEKRTSLAKQAIVDAQRYTWEARAEQILTSVC
jgi:glycosyltransferase involved in cell wall biosynthesis